MKLLVNLAAPVLSPPRHKAQNAEPPHPQPPHPSSQLLYILIKVEWERWVLLCFYSFLFPFRLSTSTFFNSFCPFNVLGGFWLSSSSLLYLFFSPCHTFSLFYSFFLCFHHFLLFLLLGTFFATLFSFPPSVLICLFPPTSPHPHIFLPLPLSCSSPPPSLPVLSFACALMGWWPFRQGSIEVKRCDGRVLLSREQRLRDAGPSHCPAPILALPQFWRI